MGSSKQTERKKMFVQQLYEEKNLHKEHRHKHVIYKLILTGSFFGIGQVERSTAYFLFIVPFIALVHDIYITSEHFKVQRIGAFIRNLDIEDSPICIEEKVWERYLENHRETWAYRASLLYTLCITIFCVIRIINLKDFTDPKLIIPWAIVCGIALLFDLFRSANILMDFKIGFKKKSDDKTQKELKQHIKELSK